MPVISPSKYCSLEQLERIRDNNYLSEDCKRDYCASEVDALIWEKQSRKAEKEHEEMLKEREEI